MPVLVILASETFVVVVAGSDGTLLWPLRLMGKHVSFDILKNSLAKSAAVLKRLKGDDLPGPAGMGGSPLCGGMGMHCRAGISQNLVAAILGWTHLKEPATLDEWFGLEGEKRELSLGKARWWYCAQWVYRMAG